MTKPKIYASENENISGENNISYYVFEKDNSFLDWLSKLLEEVLEIEGGEQEAKFVIREEEDEKGYIRENIYLKEIDKMIDLHEKYTNTGYKNKGNRVDVFYGKDRVYVTLRKSKEARKKFADFVLKTKDWIKAREVKELPIYVGKKVNNLTV